MNNLNKNVSGPVIVMNSTKPLGFRHGIAALVQGISKALSSFLHTAKAHT
jgi:hypothetical protein